MYRLLCKLGSTFRFIGMECIALERLTGPRPWQPLPSAPSALFLVIPVEHVVGIERDHPSVGMHDVDAGFLDGADIEVMGIQELHDNDPEDVVIGNLLRYGGQRQTAEQALQGERRGLRRMAR